MLVNKCCYCSKTNMNMVGRNNYSKEESGYSVFSPFEFCNNKYSYMTFWKRFESQPW